MEAARTAASRGHEVVLFEKDRRLGGQVKLVMQTPGRESFEEIILFFERQLAKLGVELRLGREAGPEDVLAEAPDAVLVATGSTPFRPEIIGVDQPHVLTAREVLQGNAEIGASVLVVDTIGRAEAPTIAEYLADRGKAVEVVTGLEFVGRDMPTVAWHFHTENLLKQGVTLTPFTGVWEVAEGAVEAYNVVSWEPRTIEGIDTVVLASGGQADDALYRALDGKVADLQAIGDCYQPRDIELAVVDGHRAAREI
jgi:NADPH-dependent 2,4-dienoyl-CoA reductase/sulfur reductase-like enzyme